MPDGQSWASDAFGHEAEGIVPEPAELQGNMSNHVSGHEVYAALTVR